MTQKSNSLPTRAWELLLGAFLAASKLPPLRSGRAALAN